VRAADVFNEFVDFLELGIDKRFLDTRRAENPDCQFLRVFDGGNRPDTSSRSRAKF